MYGELLGVPCFPGVRGHGAALLTRSDELSLHRHYHQFSPPRSTSAKLQPFPKCLSAGTLRSAGGEVLGVPAACGAPRGVAWEGRAVGSSWGTPLWAEGLGLSPGRHGAEPRTARLPDAPSPAGDAGLRSSRYGLSHVSLLGRGTLKC